MKSYLYISAALATGLSILSGCGGSSSSEQVYLPVGLQRIVDINLPEGEPYIFSFIVESASIATTYTGTSSSVVPHPNTSIHIRGYVPANDTAEQIGFSWTNALVILNNVRNICEGIGSATCSVRDAEYTQTKTQQDNCQATIRDFRGVSSES